MALRIVLLSAAAAMVLAGCASTPPAPPGDGRQEFARL